MEDTDQWEKSQVKNRPHKNFARTLRRIARLLEQRDFRPELPPELRKLNQRLASKGYEIRMPAKYYPGHPDWYEVLEGEGEHHVADEALRIFKRCPELLEQRKETIELVRLFGASLSKSLRTSWFQIEERWNALRSIESVIFFNLGVEAGRSLVTLRKALNQQGFDEIPRKSLFALAQVLKHIAENLPVREEEAP